MKYTVAMIYAANDKASCYSGFFKDIPKNGRLNYQQFVAANALPGGGSKTNCLIMKDGLGGKAVKCRLTKCTPLA